MQSGREIRACQIEDMRDLINQARSACALGAIAPYPFSDEPIIPNQTPISIRHINEFKDAIRDISTSCGAPRPVTTFRDIAANSIISTADYVYIYNEFVATSFCGDSICQADVEDLSTCAVDCGGDAQFYCNGIGGCYAAVNCPSGRNCYSVLQDCVNNAADDCAACTPDCRGKETRKTCESWADGCGGFCWGTLDVSCACSANTCVGRNCTDACGNLCAGTKVPDPSCAGRTCIGNTCSDGCGGTVIGTAASTCDCAENTCVGHTCVDSCGVTCAGTKTPSCACAAGLCAGNSCPDGCGGTCPGTKTPSCSCASSTCVGDTCSDGCGGTCAGTKQPNCSCASTTCVGSTCSNGCGGTCAGTAQADCSCASKTCVGKTCSSGCGGASCAGTKRPSCACAANTCQGSTCSDGCGGQCAGTKNCDFAPIQCKKWSCSRWGFCLQDHTATCSCPVGKKPVCYQADRISCSVGRGCPDTECRCVD